MKLAETIASLAVRIGADLSDFEKGMKEFNRSFGKIGKQVQDAGMKIGAAFTAAGGAIAFGLGKATSQAMDFESQMSNIKAVSGATGEEMGKLTDLAIEMGAKTKYSGVEAAQGIEELIKAGVSLDDIMSGGLEASLNLATAGNIELAEAAEIASTALNAFKADNLEVADAANILAGAANASATDIRELNQGLSAVSSVASSVGMSFEDTSTALAVFAQNGLKGSDAGTSLKTMLMNLQPQTKEQTALFKQLGLVTADGANAFYDTNGQLKSLDQIAGILETSMSGLTDQERMLAMETMFGSDAIRAANILYKEGAEGVKQMNAEMSKTTAAEVAAEKMNNLSGKVEELKGGFETMQISIGNALIPIITILVEKLQKVTDWFNNLSPATQEFIAIGVALTAGLLILVGVLGFLAMALGAVAAAEWAVILPLAGIIVGIAALIAIIIALGVLLYKYWDEIVNFLKGIWESIKNTAISVWNAIADFFKEWWGTILIGIFTGGLGIIVPMIIKNWDKIKSFTKETWEKIKDTISSLVTGIINWFKNKIDEFPTMMHNAWDGILNFLKGLPSKMYNLGANIMKSLKDGLGSIKLPIPTFSIEWKEGPMGVKIPDIGIGVNWKSLRDLVPFLADGGIVSSPTLAMIGEAGPEAVVPLDRYNGEDGNGLTTVIIELDGRTIAKKTFEHMGGTLRMRGAVT